MNSISIVCLALCITAVSCTDSQQQQDIDPVLVRESNIADGGKFHLHIETAKGTKITQDGHLNKGGEKNDGESIEGEFSYKGEDGKEYDITYTADERGYQPHGAHIPTSPPIPAAIQRSLDYIAAHPHVERAKLNSPQG